MALMVGAVRAAMAAALDAVLGDDVQVVTAPDQITPPCLFVGMPEIEYHRAFRRGLDRMEIGLFGILPRTHDQATVDQADAWIAGEGPQSVLTILHATQTPAGALGGACQTLVVRSAEPTVWPGTDLPTYLWTIEVFG